MVMTMIEKKDPNQKIVEDNFFDDDPIIELTDEVITNPEGNCKDTSPKTDDIISAKADEEPSLGDDEGNIVFEENEKLELRDDLFPEVDGQIADDNNRIGLTDKFGPESPGDDDVFMLADIEFEREEGEEVISMAELDNDDVETDDGIIEITEFDQHFPDDDEVLEHAGLLDPSGLADADFLELFDIEEEGPMEDEEMRELMQKDSPASNAGDSPVVSPDQIDQAIERIIREKLAGRIEHIIYEIIEKAVKREIDRLKESLLEDSTSR